MLTPDVIAALQQNAAPPTQPNQQTQGSAQWQGDHFVLPNQQAQSQGVHGRGSFLSSIISELGGAGGAAGGAAIGTALLPGVGTIIGGGLGGLIGGFGGKAVEQKVRDNQNVFGAGGSFKKDLTEGGVDAVLSAGGEGLSALKGARAASGAAADLAGNVGADVVAPAKSGVIQNIGRSLQADAGGYGAGTKIAGQQALDNAGSNAVSDTLDKLGIKAAAPQSQLPKLEANISTLQNTLNKAYSKGATALSPTEANSLGTNILSRVSDAPLLSESAKNNALNEVKSLVGNQAKDTTSLWDYLKKLNAQDINWAANPSATTADKQTVAKIMSDEIRQTLNNKIPGLADTNALYHNALNAKGYIQAATGAAEGSKLGSQSLTSLITNSAPAQTIEAKRGAVLENAGKALKGTATGSVTGPLSQVTNQLVRQTPGHVLTSLGSTAPQTGSAAGGLTDVLGAQNAQGINPTNPNGPSGLSSAIQPPAPTQSQYPISQALQDIARDPKNASTYLAINKAADAAAAAQDKSNTGSAQQQKAVYGVQNAMQTLDNVQQQFGAAGGGQGALAGRIANLGSKVNINSNLSAYNSLKTDAALQLAVGLFGATAGRSPQIIGYIRNSLPDAQDSPAVANQKINDLRQRLLSVYGDSSNYGQTAGTQPGVYDPTQNPSAFNQQQQSTLAGALGGQ